MKPRTYELDDSNNNISGHMTTLFGSSRSANIVVDLLFISVPIVALYFAKLTASYC